MGLALTINCFAGTNATPCAANPENRQLDYWLGNWAVGAEGSSGKAHSTVSLSLDKCLVVENWDGGRGHYGQNIFGYSTDDKSWHGMFADNDRAYCERCLYALEVGSDCSLSDFPAIRLCRRA
jgi:hypothetical protein